MADDPSDLEPPYGTDERTPRPMAKASELARCPFCGGAAEHDSQRWQPRRRVGMSDLTGHAVTCLACPAEVGIFDTKDDAVAAWNRRVP